jgi:hypothetical protein
MVPPASRCSTQNPHGRSLWAHRNGAQSGGKDDAARLIAALGGVDLPAGEGFVFIAGETEMARAVKAYVVDTLGHPREWVKAAGYWTRGVADSHGGIEVDGRFLEFASGGQGQGPFAIPLMGCGRIAGV